MKTKILSGLILFLSLTLRAMTGGEEITSPTTPSAAVPAMGKQEEITSPTTPSATVPAIGEQKVWAELGKIFGVNFSLTTDKNTGSINYEIGEPEGLKYFLAKSNIHIQSDMLEIKCDKFEYHGTEKVAVAQGNPVFLRQMGITANCGRFTYFTDKKRSELSENPAILSKDKAGRVVQTVGKKIYIEQDARGNTSVMVEGNAQLNVEAPSAPKPPEKKPPEEPIRIEESNIEKLKEVEMVE